MPSHNVVDTSWLYALYDEADEHHAKALKESRHPGHYTVPSEILTETLALRYSRAKNDKGDAARALLKAILDTGFTITGTDDPEPALALYRSKKTLSYPDCVAITQARNGNLLTFDERQQKTWNRLRKKG